MSDAAQSTFTNSQLLGFAEAIAALDGAKGEPYNFDTDLIWVLASNRALLDERLKAFMAAKKTLAAKHGVTDRMTITAENAPKLSAFIDEVDALSEKAVDGGGILPISKKALNVGSDKKKGQNQIAPGVLAKLYLILEE